MTTAYTALGGALLAVIITASAGGQEPSPDDVAVTGLTESPVIDIKVGLWIPRLGGDAKLGPASGVVSFENDLRLDEHEETINAELTLRFEETLYVRLSGFEFSASASGRLRNDGVFGDLALTADDPFRASLDFRSYAVEVGVDVFHPLRRWNRGSEHTDFRLALVVGARYTEIDQDLDVTGVGRVGAGGEWGAGYVGADMFVWWEPPEGFAFCRAFGIEVGTALGAEVTEGGIMAQVRAGLVVEITPGLGVTFGYRLLEIEFENDGYEFDAGLQGLFFGASIRF